MNSNKSNSLKKEKNNKNPKKRGKINDILEKKKLMSSYYSKHINLINFKTKFNKFQNT